MDAYRDYPVNPAIKLCVRHPRKKERNGSKIGKHERLSRTVAVRPLTKANFFLTGTEPADAEVN